MPALAVRRTRNAPTSTARKSLHGLLRKPYDFRPSARPLPGGGNPLPCKGGRPNGKETHYHPLSPRQKRTISPCGYVSREQLGTFLREKRVNAYCKDGLVEKSVYSRPGAKAQDIEVYRLTKAGRELCRRELSLPTYCAQNPAHDLVLADRYFSLSQSERETWRTESQSREDVYAEIRQLRDQGEEERAGELWAKLQEGRLSMPDAVYTRSDGVSVAYEVTTGNYGQEEITAKVEAAEALGAEIEFSRA